MTLTHASFFSGVGGLDMGLERARWATVSFSEIDPYASANLAHNWPRVPNLGSIVDLADRARGEHPGAGRRRDGRGGGDGERALAAGRQRRLEPGTAGTDWRAADLWTGGFPCQDLSVAGKRRGFGIDYRLNPTDDPDHGPDVERQLQTRSGLAFAFLDLVERHRPPAIILENVPGLLSSHRGRDFYALQRRMAELGYVGAYRVLDARYFGVPQRRRRVFIVALDARLGATEDDAAEVLSVGTRCDRHPATGGQAGPGTPERAAPGVDIARAVTGSSGHRHDDDTDTLVPDVIGTIREHVRPGSNTDHSVLVGPSPDARRDGAPDGLAGRLDDRAGVAFVKGKRAQSVEDDESWRAGDVAPTLNSFDVGDARTTVAIVNALDTMQGGADDNDAQAGRLVATLTVGGRASGEGSSYDNTPWGDYPADVGEDDLLPEGLDSHRYRCCGNGVVAPVAEFVGERLRVIVERLLAERAA